MSENKYPELNLNTTEYLDIINGKLGTQYDCVSVGILGSQKIGFFRSTTFAHHIGPFPVEQDINIELAALAKLIEDFEDSRSPDVKPVGNSIEGIGVDSFRNYKSIRK